MAATVQVEGCTRDQDGCVRRHGYGAENCAIRRAPQKQIKKAQSIFIANAGEGAEGSRQQGKVITCTGRGARPVAKGALLPRSKHCRRTWKGGQEPAKGRQRTCKACKGPCRLQSSLAKTQDAANKQVLMFSNTSGAGKAAQEGLQAGQR